MNAKLRGQPDVGRHVVKNAGGSSGGAATKSGEGGASAAKDAVLKLQETLTGRFKSIDEALAEHKKAIEGLPEDAGKRLADVGEKIKTIEEAIEQHLRQSPKSGSDLMRHDPNWGGLWPNQKMAEDFGCYILGIIRRSEDYLKRFAESEVGYHVRNLRGDLVKNEDVVKDLLISDDSAAGYLAPDEFVSQIIRHVNTFGVARSRLRIAPMSRERQKWPKFVGGFTVYYPDEAEAPTASDLSLGMVTLTAKKWAVLTFMSIELEEDSIAGLGEMIAEEFARAIAQAEDRNTFNGDGTSAYAGIVGVLKSPNVTSVVMADTNTSFADVGYDDIVDLMIAPPDWVRKMEDTAFFMSPEILGTVMKIKDLNGNPIFVPTPNEGFVGRLLGRPVVEVTQMPGTADDAISTAFMAFGSLRAWGMLGQRRAASIQRSTEVKWLEDMVALKVVPRQDIQETVGEAMARLETAAA